MPNAVLTDEGTARTTQVNGVNVHYHDVGEGEPLLMLPSYGPRPGVTAWLTFHKVIDAFSQRFRCIMMDLPNYGRTGPVVFHEPLHDYFAGIAVGLMHQLGYERFSGVGSSQGGQVLTDIALLHPGHLDRIICGSGHISSGLNRYLIANFPSEGIRLGVEAEGDPANAEKLRRWLNSIVYDPTLITDEIFDEMFEMRQTRQDHWDAIRASTHVNKANEGAIAAIDVPMLIIHGRFDRVVTYEQGLQILSYVRSAQLVVLNRCGHWAPFERPADYISHAFRFFDATDKNR